MDANGPPHTKEYEDCVSDYLAEFATDNNITTEAHMTNLTTSNATIASDISKSANMRRWIELPRAKQLKQTSRH